MYLPINIFILSLFLLFIYMDALSHPLRILYVEIQHLLIIKFHIDKQLTPKYIAKNHKLYMY